MTVRDKKESGHVTVRRLIAIAAATLVSAVVLGGAVPAYAYNETGTVDPLFVDCNGCHGNDTASYQGSHQGYMTTSTKCVTCHEVHGAPSGSEQLLPSATTQATCEACHDGTGGRGVYGALSARGVTPTSRHRIDTTNTIPGGNASTGETSTATFTGESGRLSCDDCHSVHNASTVASFTGDRMRTSGGAAAIKTNRLLRKRPTSALTTVTVYGSDWCGACHKGRVSSGVLGHNHPVDASATVATPFYYESVARVTSLVLTTTERGTLGSNNRGYVMPYPRSADQTGHGPICLQCHEDSRIVGSPGSVAAFTVSSVDGISTSDNPRFQTFPHEAANAGLLVETGQELCTNCHASGEQMP